MKVVIAKVDQVFYDGEAESLTAPGVAGEMTILEGHMALITTLKEGLLTVRSQSLPGGAQQFPVKSGVMEVRHDGTTVIL